MLKLTITNLEKARKNALEYAQSLNAGLSENYAPHSKFKDLKKSIYDFHTNGNEGLALLNFEQDFKHHFADSNQNRNDLTSLKNFFHSYVIQFKKKKLKVLNTKLRINFQVSEDFKLGGEIPIISIYQDTKYYAYFFVQQDYDWEKELRFPIVQHYLATEVFKVDAQMVCVGIFSKESDGFYERIYSAEELSSALRELKLLGRRINKNLFSKV